MSTAINRATLHENEQIMLWELKKTESHKYQLPKTIKGISLFTGAGGMDVGFKKAGIDVTLANELVPYACDTYEANHPGTKLLRGDIKDYMDVFTEGSADIVFGGPPCQGFSVAGKMDPDDERSKLIWSYLDVIERVRPKLFVMENVKALGTLEKWKPIRDRYLERTRKLGYCCHYFLLNSSDFGVSQNRERVFFIGSQKEYEPTALLQELKKLKKAPLSLRQLLSSLPPAGSEGNPLTCTAKITLASNPVMRRSPYAGMIFNGLGRPLNLDGVSATLPASMGGNKTPIIDSKLLEDPDAHDWVIDYHSKLWNKTEEPQFGSAPDRLRRLTIVESAAIQSFPTDYKFQGSKSAIYTQIGNAVPCKLAECVAKAIMEFFYIKG
ncbi:MAG: DNA cytosine methyltransferase [Christensenellales bacterium]